ncbi:SusC/RagA family TonB-linked outer membrane protein [Sediminicola luteus]|uniref:SusC/RagA family TonB-linked outer membrane protein n=1 Tax=Sediminicola luteus TaxID=319238 RepID=A0A2A4G6M3_9FLAO|nr:SusC/RagA family TonB-linked outer membrane protein [Sediminicola luteus]PCE63636.1 SusC/RagA family TonB-linked outer membrane protein [Sediminicola luteus]
MIKKLLSFLVFVSMLSSGTAFAQNKTVSGTVSDESGMPLPGVSIVVKGQTKGTSTDFDGNFTLEDVASSDVLVFSFIGFADKEVAVGGQSNINVTLSEDAEALDEVVVTALGVRKETKALGYSLTEVGGEEIATVKQTNAINSLQGKIAGVNITQNSTGAAGSSRVIIRGASSFGNNQPLYVIDGIPMGNDTNGSAGMWGGSDGGDGISSLNPDDIESISVLKGGAATALYGSRGGNGVIVVTTKSGKDKQGFGVEFSSSVTFDMIDNSIQDFQTEYGQGRRGAVPANQEDALDIGTSAWGPRLDGSNVIQYDGQSRPYSYTGNNLDKFYRTGTTFINSLAFSNAGENSTLRFSASDLTNEDIVPNAGLNRKSFSLNSSHKMMDKLTLDINAKYIREDVKNRPRLSDSPGNANFSVALLPPNVDVRDLQPGADEDGMERGFSNNIYSTNPYFAAYNFRNQDYTNRIITSAALRYDINDWLYLFGRAGIDHSTRKSTSVTPYGTAYQREGSMNENERRYTQVDADIMFGVTRDLTDKLAVDAFFGANKNSIESENLNLSGGRFIVPGLEDISNTRDQGRSRSYSKRKIGSLYGSVELSWDRWAYLTITGRNDWFSTLSYPGKETPNDDFYPSVSGSVVLSEVVDLPETINFLKLRGGYSQVAGGADQAYQLALNYTIFGQGHLGQSLGRIDNGSIPNANLVAWNKDEFEIGLDLRMLNNRLSFDLAYYNNESSNQIVNVAASPTSGYGGATANIGVIANNGFEWLISATPIRNENFSWTTSINGSYNNSEIKSTNDVDGEIGLGQARTRNVEIKQIVGESFGVIKGRAFQRDGQGRIVYEIDGDGVPLAQEADEWQILGEGVPPLNMGWTNTFNYKDFSLSFLIDGKFGGQIFAGTNAITYGNGLHKETLNGREGGLQVTGVTADGAEFTTTVAPEDLQTYYGRINDFAEPFVEDADFIKFRQFTLGYNVPSRYLENIFLKSVNVSVIGQNLFYLMRKVDNINPEAAYNNGNAQGLEYFGVPPTRNFGFALNVKF